MSLSAIEILKNAIDELHARCAEPSSGQAFLDELVDLRRQIDRLESIWLKRVNAAHLSGAATVQGYVTTAAFLRHTCHLTPGGARSRVDVAASTAERPALAEAFAEGAISYQHVKVVTDALAPLPPALQADAEPVLIEAARNYDPGRVAQIARRLRHIIDPDGQAGTDERHRESRWLDLASTFDGMGSLRGMLDAESAAIVRTAIDALSTRAGDLDERTPAQRRADGLVELARRALDGGELPDTGGERPHVTVIVDLATLRGESRGPAELLGDGPLGAESARRISCDAVVTRVVTNGLPNAFKEFSSFKPHYLESLPPQLRGPTQVLDVGRASRTATTAIRKALAVRDKGCVMPGCDRPPPRCEAHHLHHWAKGGVTALHNFVLLCGFHHHFVHERGSQPRVGADGRVIVAPPLASSA